MRNSQTVQMQYVPLTQQAIMMDNPYISTPKPLLLTQNLQVQRTRKVLMILIGVSIILSVGSNTITVITESTIAKNTGNNQRIINIIEATIWIIFYSFGLLAAYRYSETGLHVFAWFGFIILVITGIATGCLLFLTFVGSTTSNYIHNEPGKVMMNFVSMGYSILLLISLIDYILTVIIVSFAFKLARFIGANTHLNM